MSGLYENPVIVERWTASVSASTLAQPFIAPTDLQVVGLVAHLGTAPGTNDGVTINVSNYPTSQNGGGGTSVSAYNLWTATNVPTILGTAVTNAVVNQSIEVIENTAYAFNYPIPGPSPVTGYETAQSTSQGTYTAVTSPPEVYKFQINELVAPDNTYTDYNGIASVAAATIHAGDVLSFVLAAAGSNNSVGAAANLEIALYCVKR